jgi:hypothetical protein
MHDKRMAACVATDWLGDPSLKSGSWDGLLNEMTSQQFAAYLSLSSSLQAVAH